MCSHLPVRIDNWQDVIISLELVAVLDEVIDEVSHDGRWNPLTGVNAPVDPERRRVVRSPAYTQHLCNG